MNRQNITIKNEGYIDRVKMNTNMRILVLNLKDCRPLDDEKISMLIKGCQDYQIDKCYLMEVNTK